MKNAKLVGPSLVYILCFRLTKGAQFIFQSLGKSSIGPTFLLKVPNNVLQFTIIYFPKFREDHPGFRSPNLLGELIIKILDVPNIKLFLNFPCFLKVNAG